MPFIPDDVLETIRARADITEVVQSYVPTLKKMGATWKACCPFHQEKTPSFTVNPQRGIYKCFGCGKGGNVFSFIMEMEKLDFPNAAQLLARKYSVVIPEPEPSAYGRRKSYHSAPEASYDVRERLYQLHEKLAAWYAKQLWEHPESPVAQYFKTRLIPQETAVRFQIGAAPDSWDAAIQFAHSLNFTDEELKLAGIVSTKDDHPGHIYDRFRNRLMFPIRNEQGRVVAFSARSIEADPQGWKYVNSPETPVFKKSRTLYALDFARKSIDEKKSVVLCEGQLDVIAMHRAGCTNAVAPQGTAFGVEQASILKRYTDTVFLALDNDKAGRNAVFKDAAILLPLGFRLKTAIYPEGIKDSDEFLKKQGADALRTAVESSVDFFDFAFQYLSGEADLSTPAGKSAVASGLAKYLFLIDDPVTADAYTSWLAEKLQLDKQAFVILLERHKQKESEQKAKAAYYASLNRKDDVPPQETEKSKPVRKQLSEIHPGAGKAYYELLELLLNQEEFAARAGNDVRSEFLDKTPAGRAIEIVIQAEMNGEWEDAPAQIVMMMTKKGIEDAQLSAFAMAEQSRKAKTQLDEDTYRSCLSIIRQAWLTEQKKDLIARAMALPDDSAEKIELLKEIAQLNSKLFQRNG